MNQPNVGIREVAAAAGVSLSTVSNVLNRPEVVSSALTGRVQRAIEELGYVRNEAARSLRTGRSRSIGAVFFDLANPYFAQVSRHMSNEALRRGYLVSAMSTDHRVEAERDYLEFLSKQGIQAVAVTTSGDGVEALVEPVERGTKLVLLAQDSPDNRIGSVAVDDYGAMKALALHVLETGRTRIGYVGGPPPASQYLRRRQAVEDAATEWQGRAEVMVVNAQTPSIEGGQEAADRLLRMDPDLDALLCVNDYTALGAMTALRDSGRSIPDDVAVTGFDDIDSAVLLDPPLTTVRQPLRLIGEAAAAALIEALEGAEGDLPRRRFPAELMVRASTIGAAADPFVVEIPEGDLPD